MRFAWVAIVIGVAAACVGVAATVPPDLTGHWVGSAQQGGRPAATLSADLQGRRSVTGTLEAMTGSAGGNVVITCTLHGHQEKRVTLSGKCDEGSKLRLGGKVDAATGTITGSYSTTRHGKHTHGTFILTNERAAAGDAATDCNTSRWPRSA